MKKTPSSELAFFNPRIFFAFLLCAAGVMLSMFSFAASPAAGTLTTDSGPLTYTAGPFNQPNPSPLGAGQLDDGPRCTAQFPCDKYTLTVTLPAGYVAANPNASVKVALSWTDKTGTDQSDYDLYIYKIQANHCGTTGAGTDCNGNLNGSYPADYQSAGGSNPEVAVIGGLVDGTMKYSLRIVPFQPTGEIVSVRIELLPGAPGAPGGGGGGSFGGADPTAPGTPRFQIFVPPTGSSAEVGSGEYNIGFNPATGRIMNMNSGPIWRITPHEVQFPGQPECCAGLWEDKSSTVTNAGVDPILWTDQKSGRTLASNSTAGANAAYAYSDNDGDLWVPLAVAPPNGGDDHQTLGSGPYPAALSALTTPQNKGEAVYYCSQTYPVGPAACQRSGTLGASYGPGTLAYTGVQCSGLHGHIHVAPDGTAWLPVNQCGAQQGGSLTADGGTTWQEFLVPGTKPQGNGADPSIAIDANSTVYYAYVNNENAGTEGHARVAVGQRNATTGVITWTNDFDLGASHGVKNAAHVEAVGGSAGRAAVGFLGTDRSGDYQALDFPGKWYPFIATTYDGGATWTTVNATPNDPVQSMSGIWQQGGGPKQRNLLDFNEITVDDRGRVLYGYSDGCVTSGCIAGTAPNDFVADMRVARQTGGKSIYASYDAKTDTTAAILPKAPCLSGTRDATASHLTWKAPDNGGADITKYEIWRSTTSGTEVKIGESIIPKFEDTTADAAVPTYYYTVKAVNSVGTGDFSNEIALGVVIPPPPGDLCVAPGLLKLSDATGDNTGGPGTDLRSFQISQPYSPDGIVRLAFTINTDNGVSPQPPNSFWYVSMRFVNGATTTYKAVRMVWNGPTPTFESYTPDADNGGTVDGRYVKTGSQKPAEPGSSYAAPYDKVVIVVKASDLGLAPGSVIGGFVSAASQDAIILAPPYDAMPDSLRYTGTYTVAANSVCAPVLPAPTVVSRKTHGTAGTFDVDLPLTGSVGIEPRSGGASKDYTMVFTFVNPLTSVGGVSMTGTGSASGAIDSTDARRYIVNLTGVANAQTVTVSLANVSDSAGNSSASVSASMGVLIGDVNQTGAVDGNDVSAVQSTTRQAVGAGNFKNDVNITGRIDGNDVSLTQSMTRARLP